MELYDTFFSRARVLHIHHRRSGHYQKTGMSVCNWFVVLAWIAHSHGGSGPAPASREVTYSLSKLSPAHSQSLEDIASSSPRVQNDHFKPEPKSELPVLGIVLVYSMYQLDLFLCCWLWISSSVSNRHDHCHHYHCQYTIIAGSQASGFNLYMCSFHACFFLFVRVYLFMLALIHFACC
ncbi:hypothetical protein BDV09DRAFT_104582 [Aspergillus tetrazonus]